MALRFFFLGGGQFFSFFLTTCCFSRLCLFHPRLLTVKVKPHVVSVDVFVRAAHHEFFFRGLSFFLRLFFLASALGALFLISE